MLRKEDGVQHRQKERKKRKERKERKERNKKRDRQGESNSSKQQPEPGVRLLPFAGCLDVPRRYVCCRFLQGSCSTMHTSCSYPTRPLTMRYALGPRQSRKMTAVDGRSSCRRRQCGRHVLSRYLCCNSTRCWYIEVNYLIIQSSVKSI